MSLFSEGSYKQEIYDSLHWIIKNFNPEVLDRKEQLVFIHQNIMYLINGEKEKLNTFVHEWVLERGLSYREILRELGEMYQVMTYYDFPIE
ncbi:hypothetical protein NSQ59_27840 [Margalitia sp. FSL K6-0131]|uniref:hypothetical protein n=1 Tax=Margalitia sp. FSL K6-0131 TaxID=2954604 RepID=UPI0030F88200